MKLIDLHTHTFFSDGVLSPAELVYRYKHKGCNAVALTDHVDYSNMETVVKAMIKAAPRLGELYGIEVIAGVELTYIPPADIENMVRIVREIGAELVVVHGETSAENVPEGTNKAAVEAKCDILAHPGNLNKEVAVKAKENSVCIEITTRRGHRDTNKKVLDTAEDAGCKLVLNTDSHEPDDLLEEETIKSILGLCGRKMGFYEILYANSIELVENIKRKRK